MGQNFDEAKRDDATFLPVPNILMASVTLSNFKHRQGKSFLANLSWESWSFLKGSTEIFLTA